MMKKLYKRVEIEVEYFLEQDVMATSIPIGDNFDDVIGDIY